MTPLPVALTCGEPAGIGPEIAVKAWEALQDGPSFFLIGDPSHIPPGCKIVEISHPSETNGAFPSGLPVLQQRFHGPRTPGLAQASQAKDVIAAIETAVRLTIDGQAAAVCTNPINKKALKDGAGFSYPGHTNFSQLLGAMQTL